MRDLVSGALAEAHATHAAALKDPAGSMTTFLREAALPAVQAMNRAGALTLRPAIHQIGNAVHPGLMDPVATLYGLWRE